MKNKVEKTPVKGKEEGKKRKAPRKITQPNTHVIRLYRACDSFMTCMIETLENLGSVNIARDRDVGRETLEEPLASRAR